MVGFLGQLNISLQAVIVISCFCRESSSFSLKSNYQIYSNSIRRNIYQNPSASPSSSVRDVRLLALSLGVVNDSEEQQQLTQKHTASLTRNATVTSAIWSSIPIHESSLSVISTEHSKITGVDKLRIAAFAGCAINAFLVIISKLPPGSWRFFLAGGLCAAISHMIPTPVDVVKTRKQVDPKLADQSFVEAARFIVKKEGFGVLWAGLGPTAAGYLLEGGVKFGVYEVLKPILKCWLSKVASISPSLTFFNSQFAAFFLSGIFSGLAASFVLCPMEVLRIRLVAEPNYTAGGWVQGGYKIMKKEGLNGFTKGLNPMILKQVPYTVTKNVSFDLVTKFFYSSLRQSGVATISNGMKFTIPFLSAVVASILSSIMSQPGDTILSLSCAHDEDVKTQDIIHNTLRSDRGISGFFVGTKTRLLHVGIIVTIQLMIYDYIKRLCGIAATGL